MSKRMARAAKKQTKAVRGPAVSLSLWFAAGFVVAVPLVFLQGALRGNSGDPDDPGGLAGGPKILSQKTLMQADAHCRKGRDCLRREQFAEAFDEFSAAVGLDPTDPRAHWGLGEVYKNLDFSELAVEAYRTSIQVDSTFFDATKELGMLLFELGRNAEALEIWREAFEERPEDSFIWAELAINEMRLGRPEKAIDLLEKYNRKEGRQAWGYENLGRAYMEAGDKAKAEKAFRQALAIDSKTPLSHLWLGQLLVSLGRKPDAKEHLGTFRKLRQWQLDERLLEQAVNRAPNSLKSLVRLADVRVALGRYQSAMIPLERALRIAPQDKALQGRYRALRKKLEASTK